MSHNEPGCHFRFIRFVTNLYTLKRLFFLFAFGLVLSSCQKNLIEPESEFPIDTASDTTPLNPGNSQSLTFNSQVERLIAIKTNEIRSSLGRDTLIQTAIGDSIASLHSIDMADNDYFSHTGQNGSNPWSRAFDFGLSFSSLGENIAKRGPYPLGSEAELVASDLVEQWVNSSSHYANMISTDWQYIGVGFTFSTNNVAYGTQLFYY